MIEVKDLVKRFDGFAALDGATISVPAGSVYGLVGPNGAGKYTCFNPFVYRCFRKSDRAYYRRCL